MRVTNKEWNQLSNEVYTVDIEPNAEEEGNALYVTVVDKDTGEVYEGYIPFSLYDKGSLEKLKEN